MRWGWGALAVAAVGVVFLASGWVHAGIVSYHVVCAVAIALHWKRLRTLFTWDRRIARWTLGTTIALLAGLFAPLLLWDPAAVREQTLRTLFPWPDRTATFALFAVYTMVFHAPLEEIFWRGAFTDLGKTSLRAALLGNGAGFYLVHVVALCQALGWLGIPLALPAGVAGVVWAYVTFHTRSLWPALVSHYAVDAAILAGMWVFFIRP